jgi:hypothetical protein
MILVDGLRIPHSIDHDHGTGWSAARAVGAPYPPAKPVCPWTWRRDLGRRRMILRPSIVHERLQPVQPRRSPNRAEVLPVFPTVPPQTQLSPGATLRTLRILRTNTGDGLDAGRNSYCTYATAKMMMPPTTAMTVPAK